MGLIFSVKVLYYRDLFAVYNIGRWLCLHGVLPGRWRYSNCSRSDAHLCKWPSGI